MAIYFAGAVQKWERNRLSYHCTPELIGGAGAFLDGDYAQRRRLDLGVLRLQKMKLPLPWHETRLRKAQTKLR
jgi:hypothetical protein